MSDSDSSSSSESESYNPNTDTNAIANYPVGVNTPSQVFNNPQSRPIEENKQPVLPTNSNFNPPPPLSNGLNTPNILNSNFVVSESESSVLGSQENKLPPPPIDPNQEKNLEFFRTGGIKVDNFYATANPINANPGQIKVETKPVQIKVESTVKNNIKENTGNIPKKSSNSERAPLNPNTILPNSKYRNEFINNFETFQYKKTCAEKLCCKQLHNLDRLKRLKESDANNDKNSLCAFIHSKYQGKSKYLMEIYSIVDLYMIASLFEILEIEHKLLRLTDLFSTICGINDRVIWTLSDRSDVATTFFDKSRTFIYENLRDNNFTEYSQFPRID